MDENKIIDEFKRQFASQDVIVIHDPQTMADLGINYWAAQLLAESIEKRVAELKGKTLLFSVKDHHGRPAFISLSHEIPAKLLNRAPTFYKGERNGEPFFKCLLCDGPNSFNPLDVLQKYCAWCKRFHE